MKGLDNNNLSIKYKRHVWLGCKDIRFENLHLWKNSILREMWKDRRIFNNIAKQIIEIYKIAFNPICNSTLYAIQPYMQFGFLN